MSDTRDSQAVIAAAEQAANGGDFPAAERLLLEAATLQEASLGPAHPDLANTYNNLGVVYEITGKPEEAERSFRRAYEIATIAFPTDHPFVATSRKNLEDFCATRGLQVDPPAPPPPAVPIPPPAPAPPAAAAPPTISAIPDRPKPAVVAPAPDDGIDEPPRSLARGAGAAFVVLLAIVAIGLWYRSRDLAPPAATQEASQPAPGSAPPPAPATAPPTPAEPAPEPAQQPTTTTVTPPTPRPAQPETRMADAAPTKGAPTVVEASICRDLVTSGNWRCQAPASPITAGPLVFYTRVKSDRNTKVQHRWYRGNQLLKSSDLTIAANPGTGYRTYSRLTISGAGEWRVELRSADGALLRQEQFTVR